MGIFSFVKNLFLNSKLRITQPRVLETLRETIEFPDTYKEVIDGFNCHTIPNLSNTISGTEFGRQILNVPAGVIRDKAIYDNCVNGNIPGWMRQFKPITISDNTNTLTYFVSPDVLCVGNDDDFLRVSTDAHTARKITDLFGCMLPTRLISDQIWQASNLKMMPIGLGASFHMSSTQTLIDHNNIIERQRADRNFNIISGHKKDIILFSKLLAYPNNICIYGWHYPMGGVIQQAQYIAHSATYQDYSHSIRLVSQKALLNQQVVNLYDILRDKNLCHLISDDGFYDASRIYANYR